MKTRAAPETTQAVPSLKTTGSCSSGDKQINLAAVPWTSKYDFSNQIITLSEQFPCISHHSNDGPGSGTLNGPRLPVTRHCSEEGQSSSSELATNYYFLGEGLKETCSALLNIGHVDT